LRSRRTIADRQARARPEKSMNPLLHELFSDPVGILSLVTIGGVLVIAAAIALIIRRKMRDEAR